MEYYHYKWNCGQILNINNKNFILIYLYVYFSHRNSQSL